MTNADKLARVQGWLGKSGRTLGVYDGVDTSTWRAPQFAEQAAQLRAEGVDFVIVKCGEYGTEWYDGTFPQIRAAVMSKGLGCAPYWFNHPNTTVADVAACVDLSKEAGGVILDVEDPYVNQGYQLRQLVNGVRAGNPGGVIIVSGFGDPITAMGNSWDFSAIAAADAYQPQWYLGYWDPYLQHGWQYAFGWADGQCAQQFAHFGLGADFPIQPAINVEGVKFADLDPIAAFLKNWRLELSVWVSNDVTTPMAKALEQGLGSGATQVTTNGAPPPASPVAVPTKPVVHGKYIVVPGDSLSSIVYKLRRLGYMGTVDQFYRLNESVIGSNPNLIFAGQVFVY